MAPLAAGLTWLPSPDLIVLTSLSSPQDPSFLALSLPRPLVSPAQNGARPGAPAPPPAGWAWPLGCPTRTASADWRPSTACACLGPVHLPGAAAHGMVPSRAGLGKQRLRAHPPQQAGQCLGPEQKEDGPSPHPWLGQRHPGPGGQEWSQAVWSIWTLR